ncbi:hypothetical protein [Allomuricauda sp. AC10]|nr:hypothetical protein [Muricauda sp. AC10]
MELSFPSTNNSGISSFAKEPIHQEKIVLPNTKKGNLSFKYSDVLKSFTITKRLFDPLLNIFYCNTRLKEEFISKNHTLQLLHTAGGATTFILKDEEGRVLKDIGAVPYKEIMFPMVDKNLQYVAYTTSLNDGAEIQFLELATGNLIEITKN